MVSHVLSAATSRNEVLRASIDQRNDDAWFQLDFDLKQARALCEWAKRDAEGIGYDLGVAQSLTVLAFLLLDESELDTALTLARRALVIVTGATDERWLPRVYCALGGVYRLLGDTVRCIEHYEKQRAAARKINDLYHEAVALHDIGYALDDQIYFERALNLAETIGYQPLLTAVMSNMSVSAQQRGDLDQAQTYAERSLAIARNINAAVWESHALWSLSMIHARRGDETRAEALMYSFETLDSQPEEQMALRRAQVYDALKRDQEAIDAYQKLLAESSLGRSKQLFVLQALAPLFARQRRHREAYEAQVAYETLRKQIQKDQNDQLLRALESQHRAELAERQAADERQQKEKLAQSLVELERLNAEIGEISIRDSVTGLYSRRYLNESVSRLIAEATRYATPFSVGLLDIDAFKSVNDTYGHQLGDAVIRTVADILSHELRASDIAARYGGDELALVFPQITVHGAYVACERIRLAIENHAWHELQPGLRVTASFGLAGLVPGDSFDTLFSSADRALYAVKRSGRNGVRAGSALA